MQMALVASSGLRLRFSPPVNYGSETEVSGITGETVILGQFLRLSHYRNRKPETGKTVRVSPIL